MEVGDTEFQRQAQEAAEAFVAVFEAMEKDLPTRAVLSGLAAAIAERGIQLAPEDMDVTEAAERTVDMVKLYCAQIVYVMQRSDAA